jgi:hypothetical protein
MPLKVILIRKDKYNKRENKKKIRKYSIIIKIQIIFLILYYFTLIYNNKDYNL